MLVETTGIAEPDAGPSPLPAVPLQRAYFYLAKGDELRRLLARHTTGLLKSTGPGSVLEQKQLLVRVPAIRTQLHGACGSDAYLSGRPI